MRRRVGVVLVVMLAGCFEPAVAICDFAECDGGGGAGGSGGTGGSGGSDGSGGSGGATGTGASTGNGGVIIDGVTYQPDGGAVCPNAVTTFASAAECTPANCSDGCCDGARCIRSCAQNAQRCGVYAEACQSCASGDSCDRGSCRGSGACTGCRNTDLCLSGTLAGSCGTGAGACNVCEGCNNRTCTTPPVHVGDSCTADADCAAIGRGAFCLKQTSAGLAYPGGFCTLPCEGTWAVCTVTSECVTFPARFGETRRICAPSCNPTVACRAGYECYPGLGWAGSSTCWISPAPALVGAAPIGAACLNDDDCGTGRRCLRPFLPPRYELNGYFGGYCTAVCTPGQACGNGADVCTSEPFDTPVGPAVVNACKQPCSAPGFQGECRTDYVCVEDAAGNWCGPRCPNRSCTGGKVCDWGTGACR